MTTPVRRPASARTGAFPGRWRSLRRRHAIGIDSPLKPSYTITPFPRRETDKVLPELLESNRGRTALMRGGKIIARLDLARLSNVGGEMVASLEASEDLARKLRMAA